MHMHPYLSPMLWRRTALNALALISPAPYEKQQVVRVGRGSILRAVLVEYKISEEHVGPPVC